MRKRTAADEERELSLHGPPKKKKRGMSPFWTVYKATAARLRPNAHVFEKHARMLKARLVKLFQANTLSTEFVQEKVDFFFDSVSQHVDHSNAQFLIDRIFPLVMESNLQPGLPTGFGDLNSFLDYLDSPNPIREILTPLPPPPSASPPPAPPLLPAAPTLCHLDARQSPTQRFHKRAHT